MFPDAPTKREIKHIKELVVSEITKDSITAKDMIDVML